MFFSPKTIARFQSDYSGPIRVVQGWGFRHLSTEKIQHSGGIIREIWDTALKRRVKKHKSWLVLGVAGGTVLHLISQKYSPNRIIGVDIDPVIVDVGRKFFGLDEIPNTRVIVADAQKYIMDTREHFDYLLVDIFGVEGPPGFVYGEKFLRRIKQEATQVFINHLYSTSRYIRFGDQLFKKIAGLGYSPQICRVLANIVIIY